jgi:hypothetical protein
MTGKSVVLVLCMLITGHCVEAISYTQGDVVIIYNRTDSDIFIETEYWEETPNFCIKVNDIDMDFIAYLNTSVTRVEANKSRVFLSFRPSREQIDLYEQMRKMSLLVKMRAVTKILKITNAEGDLLFSLENANEKDFAMLLWGRFYNYSLGIFDNVKAPGIGEG